MQLVGTPLSHFTREIRILLAELGVDFEFVRAPGVMSTATSVYGDNPLMRVPTLLHDGCRERGGLADVEASRTFAS